MDFSFAYQPIVDLAAKKVLGYEALIRGLEGQPASSVLTQVSKSNQYAFDQTSRARAMQLAVELGAVSAPGFLLFVNFLPNAVYRPEVCIESTLKTAGELGFPLANIVFEVTEGERIEDTRWFAEVLREYKRRGFKTAIDDFGAGYAGLSLLADFQPDFVKLDMGLVRDCHKSSSRQAIARAVGRMSYELGIRVIAEGIEKAEERDFFLSEGIALQQGYLHARPQLRQLPTVVFVQEE